jgi:hypothetical protein
MAPVLLSLIVILCLLISIAKYTLALILKWSVPGAMVKKDLFLPAHRKRTAADGQWQMSAQPQAKQKRARRGGFS